MRVLVVDDDKLVSTSLKTILEAQEAIEVVGIGDSGEEAITLYGQCKPNILLMDIRMGGMTGLEAGEVILSRDPMARIVYLTTFADDEYIIRALKIGAKGYLLKQNFESIVPSLEVVMAGQHVFGDDVMGKIPTLLSQRKQQAIDFGLGEREFQVIQLIAEGLNNREIASQLFLSEGTVRNYISAILEKLQLRDRTQIAVFYYKNRE